MNSIKNSNYMMEFFIIDQLAQQGAIHFCIAPGSRSTPLVLAAAEHKKAKVHVHYDERGLGFYALGIAKATQTPVVLIVTSGTAVGNLLPSIMEAHHTCTPLILLTADRPPELRDCSANQTTDQVKIFSSFVRWQVDLPVDLNESYVRSIIAQGYIHCVQNPPGPVHFNCPFRDPLYRPQKALPEGVPFSFELPRHTASSRSLPYAKGLILVGKLPRPTDIHPILELAKRIQWPVCADILSNGRCFPSKEQIKYYDWIEKPTPEVVLHFGEQMTSKKMGLWLQKIKPPYIHISPWPHLQDANRMITSRVQADIPEFCRGVEAPLDPTWLPSWIDEEPLFSEGGPFTEVHALRALSPLIPPEYAIFLGNGMPIRDADHFLFPSSCRGFYGNRGLSGIDGNIATIAGLAEETAVLGLIGDQAALHDLNSLPLLKKTKHPTLLLISNNFGGGIFHHLPVAASPHFEELFAAAHDYRFEAAAQLFNIPYVPFDQLESLLTSKQTAMVEFTTCRVTNHKYQTCMQ